MSTPRRTITPPRNALVSFHYYAGYDLDRLPHLRLIGDSGAYTAAVKGVAISTTDLVEWAHQWRHRLAWVACLDVMGDEAATRRNWHEMREAGIPGVPTLHYGAPPTSLDWWAARGVDFLGLGGMVGASVPKQMRWLLSVFKYAREHHPAMRFHGWGVTSHRLLNLPFYSVDSSGWTSAVRYARLTLRDPHSARDYAVHLNGRDAYRPEVARLLRTAYGVPVDAVAKASPATRDAIVRVAALSTAVHEARMRRRHGPISAPTYGQLHPLGTGMHLHIVNGSTEQMEQVDGMHMHLAMSGHQPATGGISEAALLEGMHVHLAGGEAKGNSDPALLEAMHTGEAP